MKSDEKKGTRDEGVCVCEGEGNDTTMYNNKKCFKSATLNTSPPQSKKQIKRMTFDFCSALGGTTTAAGGGALQTESYWLKSTAFKFKLLFLF